MGILTTVRVRAGRDGNLIAGLHRNLDGLLAVDECAWLYRNAHDRKEIVEIGSYRGKSAVLLALGSKGCNGRVTAIDPHFDRQVPPRMQPDGEDRRLLREQAQRYGVLDRLHEMVMTSRDALGEWNDRPIDLLWIDGDHREEAVAFDIAQWSRFVRPGGLLAAHDYARRQDREQRYPGVKAAWDRLVTRENGWGETRQVRRLVWAVRSEGPVS